MNAEILTVRDFRNAENRTVELAEGRNAFVGANARGKTNLLEAIYISGVGKSFRTPRDREMIRSGCERASVTVKANKDGCTDTVRTVISRDALKRIAINDIPISRISELMGVCPVVLFCPDGLKIVKDAPADRRRFMDIALCQASRAYFAALSRYNRILSSRNKLLKSGGANDNTLAPWDILLAEAGSKIVKTRRGYVRSLSAPAARIHSFLTDGKESLELFYEGADGETYDEIQDVLAVAYVSDREVDLRLKFTHSGPHKDDIRLSVNGADVRTYGSQGQQRTVALSLKIAETELLTDVLGTSPILLLDDVFSELDGARRRRLLTALDGFQSVVTSTDTGEMSEFGVNIIEV